MVYTAVYIKLENQVVSSHFRALYTVMLAILLLILNIKTSTAKVTLFFALLGRNSLLEMLCVSTVICDSHHQWRAHSAVHLVLSSFRLLVPQRPPALCGALSWNSLSPNKKTVFHASTPGWTKTSIVWHSIAKTTTTSSCTLLEMALRLHFVGNLRVRLVIG